MFEWKRYPEAEKYLVETIDRMKKIDRDAGSFLNEISNRTSTRIIDWIDHLVVPDGMDGDHLEKIGYSRDTDKHPDGTVWRHTGSNLPPVVLSDGDCSLIALKVENIDRFAEINKIKEEIEGAAHSGLRQAGILSRGIELIAVDRRGYDGFTTDQGTDIDDYLEFYNNLKSRERGDEDLKDLGDLIRSSNLDKGRLSDAYFRAERRYWESRDTKGMVQWMRQDGTGSGWGNHDHHTFRCSRENYRETIAILEMMGMESRERFYAGDEAGWGAQVLEHPVCGITVFADVDLDPEEKDGDFSHKGLEPAEKLGTVGLWVGLHGESMLSAGLHHLAVLVDFKRAVMESSIPTMAPFSNFPYLKQCFTEGERWKVVKNRARDLSAKKMITDEQFERFVAKGALGSHLEFIERREGFKGFNQTAVSDIISRTDPRK